MRDFRRAVFRLLAMTAILLFGAWAALRVMQYRGDVQALLRDLQGSDAARFLREKAVPFFRDQLWPRLEALVAPARDLLASHLG